jgi:hypothetical protein
MYYTPYYAGANWNVNFTVNWSAPPLDDEYSITFQFYKVGFYKSNGLPYDPLFVPESSFGYEDIKFQIYSTFGLNEIGEDQEIKFTALNTGTASKLEIELPDTEIGDMPVNVSQSVSKLMASSGGGYSNTASWAVHQITVSGKNINKLSVDQNLLGQRIPTERYTGTFINNTITASNSLVMGTKVMVPLTLKIDPVSDEVSGEWFNCIISPV